VLFNQRALQTACWGQSDETKAAWQINFAETWIYEAGAHTRELFQLNVSTFKWDTLVGVSLSVTHPALVELKSGRV
jgi:hypothetical protein